ncbi:tumor necrosis factor receptor superfamily member 6B-like [Erpetoichthys calabaricus]|uniref:tumor necrosis factor receptor superfamily member 6B-like n=1 Tax=Erpetoichthys calabaricus TaxID=27687 RepID=UPI002234C2C5|nr:tumor necrosis factor receptor superfamily member 6B-like [Erpetoichthys calabaricus]
MAKVPFCLLILFMPAGAHLTPPTYQWTSPENGEVYTCTRCPPGTFTKTHCTRERPTECAACPELHYTQYWNYLSECLYCNVFCTELQVESRHCSPTHNRACQCREGYYWDSELCRAYSKCLAGYGVWRNGTAHHDVTCTPCEEGYFSSEASSTKACQKHRNCSEQGALVVVPGDRYHDTSCTTCWKYQMYNGLIRDSPENQECNDAVISFLLHHSERFLKRKWNRFVTAVRTSIKTNVSFKEHHSEEHTRQLLSSVKENVSTEKFIEVILKILERSRLHQLKKQLEERFLTSKYLNIEKSFQSW